MPQILSPWMLLSFLWIGCVSSASPLLAEEPGWGKYSALLNRHISQHTQDGISLAWLDYPALRHDPDYRQVVVALQDFPVERLANKREKLAFYINAYNILAIKMVLDHWPVRSIKDVGSFFSPVWKKDAGKIGGKTVTLHEIEHEILRPMGEPRIHMAIVCASLSCPDLRNEPFSAARLEEQLEDQARQFFNNRGKGVSNEGNSMRVSKILDWFAEDFGDPMAFIRHYRPNLPADVAIEGFLPYNWLLNGSYQ